MRCSTLHILTLLLLVLALVACDRTPGGVMSVNKMADLIVDLQLAEAYIDSHGREFDTDSSRLVIKQSVFKKHGITQQEYDSSLVWYAHNMEDYTRAYDKAVTKLKNRYDKLDVTGNDAPADMMGHGGASGVPTPGGAPGDIRSGGPSRMHRLGVDAKADTFDLWQGRREYLLTQGSRRGFITFDVPPDAGKQAGDRYQLAYKLTRGGNEFKVCLAVDYSDGATSQITRGTNSDGWVMVDVQSDSARHVRRIYGYVSYDMKRGHRAAVDSLMLIRTHLSKPNYGYINAQRLLERRSR